MTAAGEGTLPSVLSCFADRTLVDLGRVRELEANECRRILIVAIAPPCPGAGLGRGRRCAKWRAGVDGFKSLAAMMSKELSLRELQATRATAHDCRKVTRRDTNNDLPNGLLSVI